MAILMINLLKSSTQLEVMELKLSPGKSSTNSSKEKLIEEDSLSDLAHLLSYVSTTTNIKSQKIGLKLLNF